MAQSNPIKFLLNQETDGTEPVTAPAYSLTKVLSAAAIIVGPISIVIVDRVNNVELTSSQWVVLAVALLAFLAITASADVLARSIVTAATKKGAAAEKAAEHQMKAADGIAKSLGAAATATRAHFHAFDKPVPGLITGANHKIAEIEVVAEAEGYLLIAADNKLRWEEESKVKMGTV